MPIPANIPSITPITLPPLSWSRRHYHGLMLSAWLLVLVLAALVVLFFRWSLDQQQAGSVFSQYEELLKIRQELSLRKQHATVVAGIPAVQLQRLRLALPDNSASDQLLVALDEVAESRNARLESLHLTKEDQGGEHTPVPAALSAVRFTATFRVGDYASAKVVANDLERQARLLEMERMEYNASEGLLTVQFTAYYLP